MTTEQIIKHYRSGAEETALLALAMIQRNVRDPVLQALLVCELWECVEKLGVDSRAFWDMRQRYRDGK